MPGEITGSSLALSAGNNSMTCRYSSQNTLASNLQFALDDGIGVHGLIAREDPHHREPSAPRAARPPTAPLGPDTGIGYDQVTRLQIDHTSRPLREPLSVGAEIMQIGTADAGSACAQSGGKSPGAGACSKRRSPTACKQTARIVVDGPII